VIFTIKRNGLLAPFATKREDLLNSGDLEDLGVQVCLVNTGLVKVENVPRLEFTRFVAELLGKAFDLLFLNDQNNKSLTHLNCVHRRVFACWITQ
jgi:hypothetical protein